MSLIKRDKKYSVRYVIPTKFRVVLGRSQVWKTTGTGCLSEAKRREPRILADIIESVEGDYEEATRPPEPVEPERLPDHVFNLMQELVARANDKSDDMTTSDALSVLESELTSHIKSVPVQNRQRVKAAYGAPLKFVGSGGDYMLLSEAIKRHLKDREPNNNPSTLDRKRKALEDFSSWSGDQTVKEITRTQAGDYLDDQLKGSPGAKWNLQALSAAWRFFKRREWAEMNIWEDFGVELKGSTRGKADNGRRRPWTQEEIIKLVEAIRDEKPRLNKLDLRALLLIGLYTGARREEIAGAHIDNVDTESWAINVVEAKNQNSIRAIPIHPVIRPLVKYLKENSENDMLLPDVKRSGRDKRYGKAFDNRTTYVIRKYVSEDKKVVFHSLRHTLERRMVNKEVPLEIAEFITGHRSQYSMSFDLYAQGADLEPLHQQLVKVTYGEADKVAKEIIKSIVKS